eukprot:SAG11_NODE_263_length_11526_cov_23.830314_3_plen_59_part_00
MNQLKRAITVDGRNKIGTREDLGLGLISESTQVDFNCKSNHSQFANALSTLGELSQFV